MAITVESGYKLKIAVYTCITAGYDNLPSPAIVDPRMDYFCFTDTPDNLIPPWRFRGIDLPCLNAKDKSRFIKMHPQNFFPDYDITIYVDGNIQIVGDVYQLILNALNSSGDVFLYKHPQRNCVFTEAEACSHYSHDWVWTLAFQMRRYNAEGYPVGNGLFEAGVIIRKNTDDIRSLMGMWWDEYCSGAKRDQLSLPVVAWRLGISLGSLGESDPRFRHRYFSYIKRPKRRRLKVVVRKYINRTIASLVSYGKLFGFLSANDWK